jgi:hypothetical protein
MHDSSDLFEKYFFENIIKIYDSQKIKVFENKIKLEISRFQYSVGKIIEIGCRKM